MPRTIRFDYYRKQVAVTIQTVLLRSSIDNRLSVTVASRLVILLHEPRLRSFRQIFRFPTQLNQLQGCFVVRGCGKWSPGETELRYLQIFNNVCLRTVARTGECLRIRNEMRNLNSETDTGFRFCLAPEYNANRSRDL
ncbi:hypothetical protein CLF_101048 [Clonorchis sinensis]|uniref:Uncharacterized protein n=1 Tax=Clonorchis sinensis TaxID=79923 RepID=G7Y4U9_CLOSI|nr:hypothetical protein CLF_101048 [Clonorchis sinensis]